MSQNHSVIAKRYAVALFELAQGESNIDGIEKELLLFRDVLSSDKKLESFFEHPKVDVDKKKQMVKETFASALSQQTLNTLYLLFDRHREALISELIQQYIELANRERGIAQATVYSVRPLTNEESSTLSEVFAGRIGKQTLRINNEVDADLIGGIKIRIGNRIYDGSVNGKLKRMERQLMTEKG
jgi:F-type H+-transporting ATPase subunit delta